MKFKFDAFISYSRKDEVFAGELQRKLEKAFRKIPKQYRQNKQTFEVIRDITDLDISPDLSAEIKEKIESSKYLIVICSPHAAKSKWVSKEIEVFRQSHPQKHPNHFIIPILLHDYGKGPDKAIPDLLKINNEWPICVEFRSEIIETRQSFERYFKTEGINRIYATLLNVPYREFADRHLKHQKRLRTRAIVLTLGLSVLFSIIAIIAVFQRNKAIEQAGIANSRRLAILSDNQINIDLQQGILLGIEAYEQYPTFEARNSLWNINIGYEGLQTSHYLPNNNIFKVIGITDSSCIVLADTGIFIVYSKPEVKPFRIPGSQRCNGVGLSYSEANGLIVSNGSNENQFFIWDLNKKALVDSVISPLNENHFEFSFNGNGQYLAAATSTGQVLIWNLQNIDEPDTFRLTSPEENPLIADAMIFHDQQPLMLMSYYNGVLCRNIESKENVWIQSMHQGEITKIIGCSDTVITADTRGVIKTWKWLADSLQLLSSQKVHEAGIQDMDLNASSNMLFTMGILDETIKYWQFPDWTLLDSLHISNSSFYSCSWLPENDKIAVSEYGKISFWKPIKKTEHKISWPDFNAEKPFWWSPDGLKMGYIDNNSNIILLSLDSNSLQPKPLKTYHLENMGEIKHPYHDNGLSGNLSEFRAPFAFNKSLDYMAIQKDLHTIQTFKLPEYRLVNEVDINKESQITELTISPSGQKLAYILDNKVIRVVDIHNNKQVLQLDQFKNNGIGNISFISDDKISAVAWHPVIWNLNTNEVVELIMESERNVSSFAAEPGGQFAFSGYLFQNDILMWDLIANKPMITSLEGYAGNELRFNQDQNMLLEFDIRTSSIIERKINLSSHYYNALRMANRHFTPKERREFKINSN